jgi:hypothetical protein
MTDKTKPHPLIVFGIMLLLAYLLTGCTHTWFPGPQPDQEGVPIIHVQF